MHAKFRQVGTDFLFLLVVKVFDHYLIRRHRLGTSSALRMRSSLMGPKATCLDGLPVSQHVKQLGFMATFVKTVSLCSYCVTPLNPRQNTFVIEGIKSSACGRLQSSLFRSKRLRLSFFQGAVDEPIISPFFRPPFLCSLWGIYDPFLLPVLSPGTLSERVY